MVRKRPEEGNSIPTDRSIVMDSKLIALIVLVCVLCFGAMSSCTMVGSGQRGVVTTMGKVQDGVLGEGLSFVKPFVDSVTKMNVRYQTSNINSEAGSKDLQTVDFKVAVTWKLDSAQVNKIFQTVGDNDAILNNILSPAVNEVVKAATAKYTVEEILTKRPELKAAIDENLKSRVANYGVILDQVSITDIKFGEEYSKAIEEKQIAEQNARKAVYIAQAAEQEAKAEVNRARGKSEAQKLMRSTINDLILAQQALEKWDGHYPDVLVMGGGSNMLFNIPLPTSGGKIKVTPKEKSEE